MLKEVVFILWVCTPAAADAGEGVGPTCRPEALTAAAPAALNQQTLGATCAALNAEGVRRWGTSGVNAPDWATPVSCFAVDYGNSPDPKGPDPVPPTTQ